MVDEFKIIIEDFKGTAEDKDKNEMMLYVALIRFGYFVTKDYDGSVLVKARYYAPTENSFEAEGLGE